MGIHVAQEEEEGVLLRGQPLEFWKCNIVEIFCFRTTSLGPIPPGGIVQILIKAARTWIPGEADTARVVPLRLEDLR